MPKERGLLFNRPKRLPPGCGPLTAVVILFIICAAVIFCIPGKPKKSNVLEIKAAKLPDSAIKCITSVDGWVQEPLQWKGKTVMLWDVDERHYGRIEMIFDSTGAINGLIDEMKANMAIADTIYLELDRVRAQLKSMHDTGKCPVGQEYFEEVVTDSFTLISGCYTREEHMHDLFDGDRPRLEISMQ